MVYGLRQRAITLSSPRLALTGEILVEMDPVVLLAEQLRATEQSLHTAVRRYEVDRCQENGETVNSLLASIKSLHRDLTETVHFGFGKTAEGFARIEQRFAQIDRRFEQIDRRFEKFDHKISDLKYAMNKRFDALDIRFDGLAARITALEARP